MTADDFGLRSSEVTDLTGATYRQLDYWARAGILRPEAVTDKQGHPSEGSGSVRWWRRSQLPTIRALVALSASSGQLLRLVGQSSNPRGPWVLEQDGIRVTVQMVGQRKRAS